MKKLIKKYLKNPMLLIFIIILIFFTPMAIYSPGENKIKGVVTAIGIDKIDEEYEVSLLTFIPTANQTYKQQNAVVSGKGKSVTEAIYNAQLSMGRSVGLAHAKTTVVNEQLLNEDVAQIVDHISRISSLPENTVFICTNATAKELLESTTGLETELGLKLEQLIGFNSTNLYAIDTSLESFYKGYFGQTHSSIIGHLSLEEEPKEDSKQNEGEDNSENNEESQATQNQKKLTNKGDAVILKRGELVTKFSSEQLNALNLLNSKSIKQIVNIEDVKLDSGIHDLSYRIRNKRVLKSTKFENGYPVFQAQVILGMELTEVKGMNENFKENTEISEMNKEIKEKLNLKLKKQFTDALKILIENKTDIINITEEFFKNDRKAFNKYIKNLNSIDEFISHVNFKVSIIINTD